MVLTHSELRRLLSRPLPSLIKAHKGFLLVRESGEMVRAPNPDDPLAIAVFMQKQGQMLIRDYSLALARLRGVESYDDADLHHLQQLIELKALKSERPVK